MTKKDHTQPNDELLSATEKVAEKLQEQAPDGIEGNQGGTHDAGSDNVTAQAEVSTDQPTAELNETIKQLGAELELAKAKVEENWDHFLRTKAELDNLERRAKRDVENAHKYAGEKLLEAMLPVIDSLEMGAQAARQEGTDINKVLEGMELTLKMFEDTLHKFEVKKLDPTGTPFNPEFHQAMTLQESAEHAPNTVVSVMQKGYLLNDRLIRPALVVVSKEAKGSKVKSESTSEKEKDTNSDDGNLGTKIDEKA